MRLSLQDTYIHIYILEIVYSCASDLYFIWLLDFNVFFEASGTCVRAL